jgi:hypothetical protein
MTRRAVGTLAVAMTVASLMAAAGRSAAALAPATHPYAEVRFDPRHESGGTIAQDFVGLSIEWSLVERYTGAAARPAFTRLLHNLGSGVLRIGGSSQDVMPFEADAPNTDEIITPEDLLDIRHTLDATGGWRVVLGTAMSPPSASRPFVSPQHAHAFVTQGVDPAFAGAAHDVVGIELGNEPDLSYGTSRLSAYLNDLATYSAPDVTGPWPVIAPNTSEDILPWTSVDGQPTRYFQDWPQILDVARPNSRGGYTSDHFYPLARTCTGKPYRCPSIAALLSDEHRQSLDYQVYTHAQAAAAHGLAYRLEETNTAAGRGADGVSNVAASATYALDAMFHAACPQPPDAPGANVRCGTGAIGVNFHDAEVNAFFRPEEGNAYYNAIDYDPSDAMGAPTAAPLYYALLFFAHFAQGADGLRPVDVTGPGIAGWRLESHGQHRLFLINKTDATESVDVAAPGQHVLVDRMTPYDPTGTGKTLDAAAVRVDGRTVAANGTWPGFAPSVQQIKGDRLTVTLAPGEAAVITLGDH